MPLLLTFFKHLTIELALSFSALIISRLACSDVEDDDDFTWMRSLSRPVGVGWRFNWMRYVLLEVLLSVPSSVTLFSL